MWFYFYSVKASDQVGNKINSVLESSIFHTLSMPVSKSLISFSCCSKCSLHNTNTLVSHIMCNRGRLSPKIRRIFQTLVQVYAMTHCKVEQRLRIHFNKCSFQVTNTNHDTVNCHCYYPNITLHTYNEN